MYYEEKVIDGILYIKTSPHGGFRPLDQKALTDIIMQQKREILSLLQQVERLENEIDNLTEEIKHVSV